MIHALKRCEKLGAMCNCVDGCMLEKANGFTTGSASIRISTPPAQPAKTREDAAKVLLEAGWRLEDVTQVLKPTAKVWGGDSTGRITLGGITVISSAMHQCIDQNCQDVHCYCESGSCKLREERERAANITPK